ncbi:MAG TPA: nucleotidyltransferase domain-containing protein [Thermoplasmata archaeon]|nr:nucleotidyltransferase domain-containing protein [Thermoplasmata archaeon]
MKVHDPLEALLASPVRWRIARTLVLSREGAWSGRTLAAEAGVSLPQAIEALKRWEEAGLVWRETKGRAHKWSLVRTHVLVAPLNRLFDIEAGLPKKFQEDLAHGLQGLPIRRVVLFGSFARGSEGNTSDVDLLVELSNGASRSKVEEGLTRETVRIVRRYGSVISAIVRSPEEARRSAESPLTKEIESSGVVIVGGRP